jgi:hypothetical protein
VDELIALMMEAARTSETSVNFYQTTRRYNPEDSHLTAPYCSTVPDTVNSQLYKGGTDMNEHYVLKGTTYCVVSRRMFENRILIVMGDVSWKLRDIHNKCNSLRQKEYKIKFHYFNLLCAAEASVVINSENER